jgi:hypothetical protein
MNGRRTARLAWVAISNGLLCWSGVRVVLHRSDGLTSMLLGALLCVACVTGVILEVRKPGLARALNVGIPATVTALMASSLFWLPILAKLQHSEYPSRLLMLRRPQHFFVCVPAAFSSWRVQALFPPIRLVMGSAECGASACQKSRLPSQLPIMEYTLPGSSPRQ